MYRLHVFLKTADIEMGVLGLTNPYALAILRYGFEVSHVGYEGYSPPSQDLQISVGQTII